MFRQRVGAELAATTLVLVGAGLAPAASSATSATSAEAARVASGVTTLSPPIVQQGASAASADAAKLVGTVKFAPARRGRPVTIQRQVNAGPWQKVAVQRQNRAGVVRFVGPSAQRGRPFTYRGVAARYRGELVVTAAPASASTWQEKFSDQFTGSSLDLSKWDYRGLGQRIESRTRSVSAEEAVAVRDGSLRLSVEKDPLNRGNFLNGHIGTHGGKFQFTYGVAAARMKFPRGQGQHGAFWMQPTAAKRLVGDPKNSGAEIDVAEYFGDGRSDGGLASFIYNYGVLDADGETKKIGGVWPKATSMLGMRDDWWKNYHVFSVEWTPSSYIFRVDGREHWRTGAGVSGVEEYLILSLLTSDWELPKLDRSSLPSTMNVDWVRVWQR